VSALPTPSQTIGPFFGLALPWPEGHLAVAAGGLWLRGRVLDGAGEPVPDALVESWQADPEGRLEPRDGFRGFARCATDADGAWAIHTVKPGPVAGPGGAPQAPHVDLVVFARGLLDRVVTRVYFPEEEEANAADPVLAGIADARARATLVSAPAQDGYRFDVRLQGPDETVFFAL